MKKLINFIKIFWFGLDIDPENEELVEFRKRVKKLLEEDELQKPR